jgi:uncharacterized DUF497 family protein
LNIAKAFHKPHRSAQVSRPPATFEAARNGVVLVVHTLREISENEELIRIMSARHTTSQERKAYEEGEY